MNIDTTSVPHLSPKMKMADAIHQYHSLLTILPRLGIPLGFGEKSIGQLCAEHRVSEPLFMLISRVYCQNDYFPTANELQQCPMTDILQYLTQSHVDYLENKLPHIERHLHKLLEPMDPKYSTLISNFYTEFRKEVKKHFQYEEEVIFPYLRQFISEQDATESASYQKSTFHQQHDDIEDTLNDLTNLLLKYIPAEVSSDERVDMLLDMYALSNDIAKHAMMEDRILVPYIQLLESKRHE
ncbi:MAG: hemerythrin domain-containing protein [Bacteroidales bacterium]|nr:hemerythrin domain-containing protein [Bacteroidales bacterium]